MMRGCRHCSNAGAAASAQAGHHSLPVSTHPALCILVCARLQQQLRDLQVYAKGRVVQWGRPKL